MHFYKDDGLAVELECGQERGGHFYCTGCAVNANRVYELYHVARCKVVIYLERQQAILHGLIGRRLSMMMYPKPFQNTSKVELEKEVRARRLETRGELKPDLKQAPTNNLQRKVRVPALLFLNPEAPFQNLNLKGYEVLPSEPVHDLAGHIGNLLAGTSRACPPASSITS